jgi:predicted nucleotidyltransferase
MDRVPPLRRLGAALGWTRHSSVLLGGFLLTVLLIAYIWWPLAEEYLSFIDWNGPWWLYMDWLLIGIFSFMSLTIIAKADLRRDAKIVLVGLVGGLAIEGWGTQTNIWFYYTQERPPLWIIPAWPIASLSIDRITRLLSHILPKAQERFYRGAYWLTFGLFYLLMLIFVFPTLDKSLTWLALIICALIILSEKEQRTSWLIFLAGSGLGYFLEVWGTTRECWTYYTYQTPPLFAVLAHGMAAVVFWRIGRLMETIWDPKFSHRNLAYLTSLSRHSRNGKIKLMDITSILSQLKTGLPGILTRYPVVAAYLFGSVAQDQATPLSDVDIALVFSQEKYSSLMRLELELEIEDQVSRVCEIPNVEVRIINDAPLMIKGEVLTKGVLIFSKDEEARIEFETRTRMEYFDFIPVATFLTNSHLAHVREQGLNG